MGRLDIVKILVEQGQAKILNHPIYEGISSPLDDAKKNGYPEIVQYLEMRLKLENDIVY